MFENIMHLKLQSDVPQLRLIPCNILKYVLRSSASSAVLWFLLDCTLELPLTCRRRRWILVHVVLFYP